MLLERFISRRDEAAFATLVRRHGQVVMGVCRHVLHHHDDAEDAFQATFLVLARKAADIRKRDSVASWLHGVAYRIALKAKKTLSQRRRHEAQAASREMEKPVSQAAFRELQARLDEEISRLPEKYRTPFILCCLTGKSREEAAEELGWKKGTVSSPVAKARALLQQRLARRGLALSAALCASVLGQGAAAAAVTTVLAANTVRGSLRFAAGDAMTAPAQAVVWAEGAIKAMAVTKLRAGVGLFLLLGLLGPAQHGAKCSAPPSRQSPGNTPPRLIGDGSRPPESGGRPTDQFTTLPQPFASPANRSRRPGTRWPPGKCGPANFPPSPFSRFSNVSWSIIRASPRNLAVERLVPRHVLEFRW